MPDSPSGEGLFVRLYLDPHIKLQLADDLRAAGYDVLTSQQAGMAAAADEEQLAFATREDRAILTFNIRDFAPLHHEWSTAARTHGGIIVSQQLGSRQYGLLLRRMLRLLNEVSADEIKGALLHLEQFRE